MGEMSNVVGNPCGRRLCKNDLGLSYLVNVLRMIGVLATCSEMLILRGNSKGYPVSSRRCVLEG